MPRADHSARRAAAAVAFAAFGLAGCVQHGDFGRIEPSNVARYLGHDVYHHVPGFQSDVGFEVPLTAPETEMRTSAYTLAFTYAHMPSHDHWSEPNRFIKHPFGHEDLPIPEKYVQKLNHAGFRAPEGRLNAIVDDMRADIAGMDAFERAALDVAAADATRLIDLERLRTSEKAAQGVATRVAENRQIVDQTEAALVQKIAGYELALGDAIVAGGEGVRRAGASLELENIKRRLARLQGYLRGTEGRYALNLPRERECLDRSIAGRCR